MKNKNYSTFLASAEVFGADISLICGDITITGTDEFIFKTQRASHSYVKVTEQGGKVKIKQFRKPFFHRAAVNIYVPRICLPDLNIKLKNGKVTIKDGVYGDLRLKARTADVEIINSTFADAEMGGNTLNLECSASSVSSSFLCTADSGKALMTGGSCTKIYLTYKQGDYGVSDFEFRDGVYTLGEGSINLCINGNKDDYSLDLLAKNGTCNINNVREGLYALKAYTGNGNITVDFTNSDNENGND